MPTVSEQLRLARESQQLSIHQVAEVTKIRTDHLRALDEGNYDVFTAPVYIKGFVRTYANLLKLDVPSIMASLDQELSRSPCFAEPPALTPPNRTFLDRLMYMLSKIKWKFLLPVAGTALLAWGVIWGFQAWRHARDQDPLSRLGPGLLQSSGSGPVDTLPLPSAP